MAPSQGRVELTRDHVRWMRNVVGFTAARVDLTGERVDLTGERVDLTGERVDLARDRARGVRVAPGPEGRAVGVRRSHAWGSAGSACGSPPDAWTSQGGHTEPRTARVKSTEARVDPGRGAPGPVAESPGPFAESPGPLGGAPEILRNIL